MDKEKAAREGGNRPTPQEIFDKLLEVYADGEQDMPDDIKDRLKRLSVSGAEMLADLLDYLDYISSD